MPSKKSQPSSASTRGQSTRTSPAKPGTGLASCSASKWERVARIHALVNRDQRVTPERLAEEIGVSYRTIMRTTRAMVRDFDMPLIWDRKANTYYFSEPCPFLPTVRVEADEDVVLELVRHLMPGVVGPQAGAVLEKVLQKFGLMVAGKNSFAHASRPSVLVPSALPNAGEFRHLVVLQQAIDGRLEVRLDYRKSRAAAAEPRVVHPLDVVYIKQRWMLALIDPEQEGAMRTFRLDRIRGLALTGGSFERPADLDLAERLRGNIGCYTGNEDHEVRILLSGFAAEDALTCPWHPSQEEIERDDGRLEIILRLNNLIDIVGEVLQRGAEAEVLSPPALRERVKAEHKAATAVYA